MKKIQPDLYKRLQENSSCLHAVVIVHEKELNVEKLNLSNCIRSMQNIIGASLSGKEILELAEHPQILSIESNTEISTL